MIFTRALQERTDLHERVRQLSRNMFVDYPVAQDVMADVEWLTLGEHCEPQGRLIVAKTGNGKTAIAKRILRRFPACNDPSEEAAKIPVLRVLMPGKASRCEFARQVLRGLGQTRKPTTSVDMLLDSVFKLVPALGVRTLLLDDFQHLNAGANSEKLALRNEIKKLGEECNVNIIALGVETALNLVNLEGQLLRRLEPIPLPLWGLNDDLRSLVYHLEQKMGLEKDSNLADNDAFLKKLIILSEGTIGAIIQLVRATAVHAMLSEKEKIIPETLDEISWIKPSERILKARANVGLVSRTHGKPRNSLANPTEAKAA